MTNKILNKNIIRNRFDNETDKWSSYEKNKFNDIIGWEVYRRKMLVYEYLNKNFADKNIKILEIGCGAGGNIAEFNKNNGWKITGVDISPKMIEYCKNIFSNRKSVDFRVLDIDAEKLDEKFDVIILLGVIGYVKSLKESFRNINAMLQVGGELIFTFGNKASIFRHLRNISLSLVKNKFAREFLSNFMKNKLGSVYTGKNFFKLYYLRKIKKDLPSDFYLADQYNLCFSAGLFGKFSVTFSRLIEKVFIKYNFLNLAMTKLLIFKKK